MIRFVDIRGQGIGNRFAFYDTVIDRFLEYAGNHAWESFSDFACDLSDSEPSYPLERFRALSPAWVDDGKVDDVVGWYAKEPGVVVYSVADDPDKW